METEKFRTLIVGNTEWMLDDLDLTTSSNGVELQCIETDEEWEANLHTPAYRHPKGTTSIEGLGLLYNLTATAQINRRAEYSGIAPKGWRIPSEEDWQALGQAAEKDPSISEKMNFIGRKKLAYCSNEDSNHGAYWWSDFTIHETWGYSLSSLNVTYFAGITKWGCFCDYALFIRCVRSINT